MALLVGHTKVSALLEAMKNRKLLKFFDPLQFVNGQVESMNQSAFYAQAPFSVTFRPIILLEREFLHFVGACIYAHDCPNRSFRPSFHKECDITRRNLFLVSSDQPSRL